jgi:hypothetical protein
VFTQIGVLKVTLDKQLAKAKNQTIYEKIYSLAQGDQIRIKFSHKADKITPSGPPETQNGLRRLVPAELPGALKTFFAQAFAKLLAREDFPHGLV